MVQFGAWLVWLSCGVVVYWPLFGGTYPPDCPIGRLGWPLGAFAVAVPAVFLSQMRDFRPGSQAIVRVALAVFVIGYVAMTSSFLVWLRLFQGNRWGMTALISLILITKLSDTGAYAAGRLLGRNRMAPVLSPKKTWEGAAGGVVAAILASWLYFAVAPRWIVGPDAVAGSVWGAAVYGVVLAFAGIVGDLSESLLKRDVEQKDSGTLPGLGGVLDIIDSLLFAAAPAYLCWAVGLVGPGGS